MKTLFKDEVIAKLRKLPTFVWYILYAASFFFMDASTLISDGRTITDSYKAGFEEIGMTGVNFDAMAVFIVIFAVIIYTVIFELIVWIAHSVLQRRFPLTLNKSDFAFRLRLLFIISHLILGCVGIVGFFSVPVWELLNAIFAFAVPALLLMWFYEDFRTRYVPKRNQHTLFKFVAMIYIGIYLALSAIYLVYNLVLYSGDLTALEIASLCVDTLVISIVAVVAYFDYRRLSKIAREPEDNDLFIKKEENNNDDIFKDLGF